MHLKKLNKKSPLHKQWTWDYSKREYGEYIRGVEIRGKKIKWWSETYPPYAGGYSSTQSVKDFLLNGPKVSGVPGTILKEIKEFLHNQNH
jgi:hypothetical protein